MGSDPRAAGAPCPNCNGDGKEHSPYRRCIVCRGTGKVAGAPPGEPLGDPDAELLMAAAHDLELLTADMAGNVPEPTASQLAAVRRIASRLRAPSAAGAGDGVASLGLHGEPELADLTDLPDDLTLRVKVGDLRAALAGRSRAPEPSHDEIEERHAAMVRRLQDVLNCEPTPDDEGWQYDQCERVLAEVWRAGAAPSQPQEEKL